MYTISPPMLIMSIGMQKEDIELAEGLSKLATAASGVVARGESTSKIVANLKHKSVKEHVKRSSISALGTKFFCCAW